jgi:hypothetical protein
LGPHCRIIYNTTPTKPPEPRSPVLCVTPFSCEQRSPQAPSACPRPPVTASPSPT